MMPKDLPWVYFGLGIWKDRKTITSRDRDRKIDTNIKLKELEIKIIKIEMLKANQMPHSLVKVALS